MSEQDYVRGSRSAYRLILLHCLQGLDIPLDQRDSIEKDIVRLATERDLAVSTLRRLCDDYGDNDWDDNLALEDVIEKHLGRHLDNNPTSLVWSTNKPTKPGVYSIYVNNKSRAITVWRSSMGLCTNEDGGASLSDEMYNNAQWFGPIPEPKNT